MMLPRVLLLVLISVELTTTPLQTQSVPAPPHQRPLDPVGEVILDTRGQPSEGSLPVAFVRSPDTTGPGGGGRYLVVVNSGYGVQFTSAGNKGQQLLQVIDLAARPAPVVVQSVYFPSPQSVNVGVAFGRRPDWSGAWPLYASGGFENRIWRFAFSVGAAVPIAPSHDSEAGPLTAPSIDLRAMAPGSAIVAYNGGREPLYPTGLAISGNGRDVYVANNLGDSLGIVRDERADRVRTIDLRDPARPRQGQYPYDVRTAGRGRREKVYVSCWNGSTVVVINPRSRRVIGRIAVGAHPNAMVVTADGQRLLVASANSDTVSVIDTRKDREVERISVGLVDEKRLGNSPEALALSGNERMLFVANAQTQSVAIVKLSDATMAGTTGDDDDERAGGQDADDEDGRSRVLGYMPTARYPSALAAVGGDLFIGNGKGEAPARPNAPTAAFPATDVLQGAYSVSLMRSSVRRVPLPDPAALARMTARVLELNGLVGPRVTRLFAGPSPITHVVYVIKENRTYDQVFGDLAASGDGTPADGDPSLAIFGAGDTARRRGGPPQNITPNHRALALRFGLFDRFFVNSEASPDGHNWSTAAFSTDYVDKAFRWNYSDRGRTYDFEGFNRAPAIEGERLPPELQLPVTARDLDVFMRRFVPYLNGGRDVAEPDSLYLWDAAARTGLTHRNYGEFIGTLSADDVTAVNERREKIYPDVSPTVVALPTKATLEDHFNPAYRGFDMWTPDAFTAESYRAAVISRGRVDPVISTEHADGRFRGTSRVGTWLEEFRGFVADLDAGRADRLPALSIMHLPNDHTIGLKAGHATPQFLVADNDYAIGRIVDAVSHSPYWKNTAIFVLEDDAQDGPDHVDAHRSPVLVISAYNTPGRLVHAPHNTVSLIRTLELLLGLEPMNVIDAAAVPMDVFQEQADLTPYTAVLPQVADDNVIFVGPQNASERHWAEESERLPLSVPDVANPLVLNQIIWFSVRGDERPMPPPTRFALVDVMRAQIDESRQEASRAPLRMAKLAIQKAGARRR